MLHRMNPTRVAFIRAAIERNGKPRGSGKASERRSLAGVKILDVGCGVGILSEPLARLGADVLGVDASEASIIAAKKHCSESHLESLQYRVNSVEDLLKEEHRYDCVIASEVIEHVNEPSMFLTNCTSLLKSSGVFVLSSINRTVASYLLTISLAENVLGLLPPGTHNWRKYPSPEEIAAVLKTNGLQVDELTGMIFNIHTRYGHSSTSSNHPVPGSKKKSTQTMGIKSHRIESTRYTFVFSPVSHRSFSFTTNTSVNYILSASRK